MDFFGKKILSIAGIHRASMQTTDDSQHHHHNEPHHHYSTHRKQHDSNAHHANEPNKRERYSGIPAIPKDIGYNSGKATGGSHSTGVLSNVSGNPAVILGMGLTTMALLGMIRRSVLGDKVGTQKYMRYRIIAQFFTVTALVAGVTLFASNPNVATENKPAVVVANSAN